MELNDIVIVSDEFETTNGDLFGQIGCVTSIKRKKLSDNGHFFQTNDSEIFHESELTILNKGDSNGGN
ncbi:hypothetical protein SNF32_09170 [Enterococcus mundtii]|nr:hypothetical protein [Enterococcus mundtii]